MLSNDRRRNRIRLNDVVFLSGSSCVFPFIGRRSVYSSLVGLAFVSSGELVDNYLIVYQATLLYHAVNHTFLYCVS